MAQLLLEIFSEEIPARMQGGAGRDLERLIREQLAAAGLTPETLTAYAGPRRLTLVAEGLPAATPDVSEELKGPKTSAPEQALKGFLRKTGLTRADLTERDGVFFAALSRKGRPTSQIIAEAVDAVIRAFPWPKSMRWGTGSLRWVRPIQSILCVFDSEIVNFAIDGIQSGDKSRGHRFMGEQSAIEARDFDAYARGLEQHFVVLDAAERKRRIMEGARAVCAGKGVELIEDEGLLEEVAGLAEWPVPVIGDMDPAFLALPPEVIRTSMRTHQKYFAVRDPKSGGLAPHFVTVANIEASDGGAEIARGNAKVLSARLNDARFFWDEDRKAGFGKWLEKLNGVTFHARLGTMAERMERITALAREIAPLVGADPDVATAAARRAKADLASGMVGEFPELQGIMGGYYAKADGLAPEIADAVRDHYKPQGPNDAVPTAPVTVAVALADKLDTLVGFFAIDEKPTGSKDPYALRRAALGVIRIVLKTGARLPLYDVIDQAYLIGRFVADPSIRVSPTYWDVFEEGLEPPAFFQRRLERIDRNGITDINKPLWNALGEFFVERLKVVLRDDGKRPDLIDASYASSDDDLVRIVARVEALEAFLATEDGANLLAGYKRATNILKAEEKKAALPDLAEAPVQMASASAEETALIAALAEAEPAVDAALATEDFAAAMTALSRLRGPVDAFFDKVLVNSDDAAERENRLRILAKVRDATAKVADFSKIAG